MPSRNGMWVCKSESSNATNPTAGAQLSIKDTCIFQSLLETCCSRFLKCTENNKGKGKRRIDN
jgi:hypothetical protein